MSEDGSSPPGILHHAVGGGTYRLAERPRQFRNRREEQKTKESWWLNVLVSARWCRQHRRSTLGAQLSPSFIASGALKPVWGGTAFQHQGRAEAPSTRRKSCCLRLRLSGRGTGRTLVETTAPHQRDHPSQRAIGRKADILHVTSAGAASPRCAPAGLPGSGPARCPARRSHDPSRRWSRGWCRCA
jgi:hypothetical protein